MTTNEVLRITLAQTDLVWENPEQNRRNLEDQILGLSGTSDLVILPETFTTGFSMRRGDFAETMDGPTISWMLHLSQKSGLAIAGSLLIKDNERCFNRFVFVTPGQEIFFYDKRHLFSIGGESGVLSPGDQRVIVNYLGWKIALYVCYDLRFPVWCRNVNSADLLIFTSNWPESRKEVWNILLKARAIENQVYVAGVNRIGTDEEGINYIGESQMINARGEVMLQQDVSQGGWVSYLISKREMQNFRDKFPVSNDADHFIIN